MRSLKMIKAARCVKSTRLRESPCHALIIKSLVYCDPLLRISANIYGAAVTEQSLI